jgi:hypothetical protein
VAELKQLMIYQPPSSLHNWISIHIFTYRCLCGIFLSHICNEGLGGSMS